MIKNVLIILPTYNESENIGPMLKALQNINSTSPNKNFEVLVLDDNSPDDTQSIVRGIMKTDPAIHLVRGKKEGLGRAYVRGFRWGLKRKQYDAFIMMDADFSHDPKKVPILINALDAGSDYVIGSRYIRGGHIPGDWPLLRIINSRVANFIGHFLGGIDKNVSDITGGFKAIRVEALRNIDLERLNAAGYFFQVNLVHEFLTSGFKVSERPISFTDRELGSSKFRLRDVVEFLYRAYMLNSDSPARRFVRFGLVGICGTIVNLAVLTLSIKSKHLSPLPADLAAIEISIITNFFMNHWYTFKQKSQDTISVILRKLGRFNLGAAAGATLQFLIFSSLLKLFGFGYISSDVIAIGISLFWNYWMSAKLVWRITDATD